MIRKALDPLTSAASTQREAGAILASAHGTPRARRSRMVVGVQVRLGDKVNSASYSSVYAAAEWDYYREAMRHMARTLEATGAVVAFIITAGGGSEGNAADVAMARRHLSEAAPRVFFSTAEDPYVDLAVLRRCDALVIGPSTLGWWAAYLANLPTARVVAPVHVYGSLWEQKTGFHEWDYYPPGWLLLANNGTGTPRHPEPKLIVNPRSWECQLIVRGDCKPGEAYRTWFTAGGAAMKTTAARGCENRRRSWTRTCTQAGSVGSRLVGKDSAGGRGAMLGPGGGYVGGVDRG